MNHEFEPCSYIEDFSLMSMPHEPHCVVKDCGLPPSAEVHNVLPVKPNTFFSDHIVPTEQGERVAPCPWCGAVPDEEDRWGSLIAHTKGCYWRNIRGDSIGRVRVNNSEKQQWNTRAYSPAKDAEIERLTNERNQLATQGGELFEQIAAKDAVCKQLALALENLIHQLPNDERLADFNLDHAEAALTAFNQLQNEGQQ